MDRENCTVWRTAPHRAARAGFTIVEQVVVMALTATVLAAGIPRLVAQRDAAAVRGATGAVRDAFGMARDHAIASGMRTAVRFSRDGGAFTGTVVVHAATDSLHRMPLHTVHGVSLVASRDSMTYLPSGLGLGAANLSVIIARGARADTVTVSRLGRVR
jgi:Tfp pilus assembly protein FimT